MLAGALKEVAMPKAVAPGTASVPGVGEFIANAVPDPFDGRDLEYRPRLQPLPFRLDKRSGNPSPYVMQQQGQSCTGHAVATVINTVLAQTYGPRPADLRPTDEPLYPVSPYM